MALVWYIKKFNYAFLWHIMFYINFRTMLEKRNQTNDEKDVCIYIYAYKAFVCQRQKKNARCVKKYLFLLRIQISYKKGKSNKHIGIYLNAVHKNHQHIYAHIR